MWTDYKFNIRKKLRSDEESLKITGGGPSKPSTYNKYEEKIIEILDMDKAVAGVTGECFGASTTNKRPRIG